MMGRLKKGEKKKIPISIHIDLDIEKRVKSIDNIMKFFSRFIQSYISYSSRFNKTRKKEIRSLFLINSNFIHKSLMYNLDS